MATSRTGTTSHINWRKKVLARDKANGITNCPICNVRMDYNTGRLPNSAEPDHIIPWSRGGGNTLENGRAICRQCNQKRGACERSFKLSEVSKVVFRSVANGGW